MTMRAQGNDEHIRTSDGGSSRLRYNWAWYENADGLGSFGERQVITSETGAAMSLYAADLDGDEDVDVILTGSSKVARYENVPAEAPARDANRDGVFSHLDIVQILQAVKYLTGEPATWEHGDGVFDQLDIVAAL